MRIAHILDGLVVNVSMGDLETSHANPGEILMDAGDAGPGWTWTAEGGFGAPVAPEPPAPVARARLISRFAFRNRLTLEERVTAETAAATSPLIRVLLDDLAVAEYVDLDIPILATMLGGFEAQGILGVGRATEILAAEIQPHERPTGVA